MPTLIIGSHNYNDKGEEQSSLRFDDDVENIAAIRNLQTSDPNLM
jgi:hypothetical protein